MEHESKRYNFGQVASSILQQSTTDICLSVMSREQQVLNIRKDQMLRAYLFHTMNTLKLVNSVRHAVVILVTYPFLETLHKMEM